MANFVVLLLIVLVGLGFAGSVSMDTDGLPLAPHLQLKLADAKMKRRAPPMKLNEKRSATVIVKKTKVPLSEQLLAAESLVRRVLPKHLCEKISFEPIESGTNILDGFSLDSPEEHHLRIRATSGVAAASGLRYYLNRYAFASVHWGRNNTGTNVAHLKRLPTLKTAVTKQTKQRYRYYFNAVTFGYSAAFWDWKRWESEIDWVRKEEYLFLCFFVCFCAHLLLWKRLRCTE
jgi:hypothetical protein